MNSPHSSDDSVSADDVRTIAFTHAKRGGYDTQEVDAFLDRVLETLLARGPGSPASGGEAQLYDPEGAAQRLLAAAQRTADTLTAEADVYAKRLRGEVDEYAEATRAEADQHAATVTGAAEAQAETIKSVATEETRRMAEEARSSLVSEVAELEAARDALASDCLRLGEHAETARADLLERLDAVRGELANADLRVAEPPELTDVVVPELAPVVVETSIPTRSDASAAASASVPSAAIAADTEAKIGEASSGIFAADEDAALKPDPVDEEQDAAEESLSSARDVEHDQVAGEPDELVEPPAGTTTVDVIDDEEASTNGPDDGGPIGDGTIASIFDVEADDGGWDDSGPPTQAMPKLGDGASGEDFFAELRQAERESDSLGPLDDDTDAALAAFFEPDDEVGESSRWSKRFG